MCLGQQDCYCREGEDEEQGHSDGHLSLADDDASQMAEVIRPDAIDFARDGDTRHFYDDDPYMQEYTDLHGGY